MPKVRLTRRATFSASHRLHAPALSDTENEKLFGKCNRPNGHGHNYVLEVTVEGEVDPKTGLVLNLTDLKHVIETAILDNVDHRHLNHDVGFLKGQNPTTEVLVVAFWKELARALPKGLLAEVRLWETENNSAVYSG